MGELQPHPGRREQIVGWVYRPVSWQGLVLALSTEIFCLQVFFVVDQESHYVSDTLYGIFPYFVPSLMLLKWIPSKTSGRAT